MFMDEVGLPLVGGAAIGLASALLLILAGRVAGVSGIFYGVLSPARGDAAWRWAFVLGLAGGGALAARALPGAFPTELGSLPVLALAGLLVGFGARLGGGCTSGHGVCGIGRLSPRGIVATLTFLGTGILTVLAARVLH